MHYYFGFASIYVVAVGGRRGCRCDAGADVFRQFYSNRHTMMPISPAFRLDANVEFLYTHLMLQLMIELEQMQLIKCQMAPEMNTILIKRIQQIITQNTYRKKTANVRKRHKSKSNDIEL